MAKNVPKITDFPAITLKLRDGDVQLFLQALEKFEPSDPEIRRRRAYWLDILGYLAFPAD
jgi:hypothetical protein